MRRFQVGDRVRNTLREEEEGAIVEWDDETRKRFKENYPSLPHIPVLFDKEDHVIYYPIKYLELVKKKACLRLHLQR